MVATTAQPMAPPDRGWRYKLKNQTPLSASTLVAGALVLVFLIVGALAVLTAFGWSQVCEEGLTRLECSPSDPLARGIASHGMELLAQIVFVAGLVVAAFGFSIFRRMPSKPSQDAAIAGAVLALQGVLMAFLILWFRGTDFLFLHFEGTDVRRFSYNFLNVALIGERSGFVWQSVVDAFGHWGLRFAFDHGRPSLGIDGLVPTAIAVGALAALIAATVQAVQHGGGGRFARFVGVGIVLGIAQGVVVGIGGGLLVEIAVRTFVWGVTATLVGLVVVGGRSLFVDRIGIRTPLLAGVAGIVLGGLWVVLGAAASPSFIKGAQNTLVLSGAGAALGFGLGLVLALFTMSSRAVVRAPARIYINFFRGTPLIWQIAFAGIGFVPALQLDLDMYTIAILVLGLNLAAYSAEVYRAGIQSLERGQIEAARAVGLSYFQSMRFVVVPQAIRRVIPPLLNEFVILIKDTSLVSVLGLTVAQKELLGVARDIYSSTFDATAWLGAAAGYLIITIPMIRIVTIVERRLRSGLTSVIG